MSQAIPAAIQPPTGTLVLRPRSGRQITVICFLSVVFLVVVGMGILLSPYSLFLLLVIAHGIVFPILYLKNGFVRVSPDGIELSGFTGKITKKISYDLIHQVVLAEDLIVAATNGAYGYAVVFLDKNGDQLTFVWSVQYSKDQITALYDLFNAKDKVRYIEAMRLHELKDKFLKAMPANAASVPQGLIK